MNTCIDLRQPLPSYLRYVDSYATAGAETFTPLQVDHYRAYPPKPGPDFGCIHHKPVTEEK